MARYRAFNAVTGIIMMFAHSTLLAGNLIDNPAFLKNKQGWESNEHLSILHFDVAILGPNGNAGYTKRHNVLSFKTKKERPRPNKDLQMYSLGLASIWTVVCPSQSPTPKHRPLKLFTAVGFKRKDLKAQSVRVRLSIEERHNTKGHWFRNPNFSGHFYLERWWQEYELLEPNVWHNLKSDSPVYKKEDDSCLLFRVAFKASDVKRLYVLHVQAGDDLTTSLAPDDLPSEMGDIRR